MTESADVVIIGGGAIGTSVAFHLAERGIANAVLLERDTLAAGSTGKAAGGIRLQFADELNVRIMLRSLPTFESFAERVGGDIGFRQLGYLFLLSQPAHVEAFAGAVELQRRLGVPARILSVDEALDLVPGTRPDGLAGAVFCPRDGYATPEAVVHGYADAARRKGVRVRQGCAVVGVDVSSGRIAAVRTTAGTVRTDTVICAAGVGSQAIGRMVGVEIPVRGEEHWIHFSPNDCGMPRNLPLTIDFATGFYMHREEPGLVFGGREAQLHDLAATAVGRFPALQSLEVRSSWCGDYDVSPDHNAVVGESREVTRFLYATGFSGHGFQQSPAIGEHLADLVTGRPPHLDLTDLGLDRFAEGRLRTESFFV